MTTVASGRWTSAPVPVAVAAGTNPTAATSAVLMRARSEASAACLTRSRGSRSSGSSTRFVVITMPVITETPQRAMNPTPAGMLKDNPRAHNEKRPPASANGRLSSVTTTYLRRRNVMKSMMAMPQIAIGTRMRS